MAEWAEEYENSFKGSGVTLVSLGEKHNEEAAPKAKKEKVEYPIDFDDPKPEDPLLQMSYYEASKEKAKTENLLKKLEQKSAEAEEKLKKLNEDFVNPEIASDFTRLMEI